MASYERSLVGSVFERTTPRTPPSTSSRFCGTRETGFPVAHHRFKSAFARAKGEANLKGSALGRHYAPSVVPKDSQIHPTIASDASITNPKPIPTDTDALLRQIHEENNRTIAHMSEEQIEKEKHAILEQLGEGTEQLLRRVREARRRKEAKEKEAQGELEEQALEEEENEAISQKINHTVASPTPRRVSDGLAVKPSVLRVKSLEDMGRTVSSPLPATSSTRPSSRTGRKLRFAEVTPDDVHVYESAPRSPKRASFALPPPPDTKDDSIVSLGMFNKNAVPSKRAHSTDGPAEQQRIRAPKDNQPEEGTPEYIRRRYFPNVPANDPNLAWMEAPPLGTADPSAPRFDLHGVPISASLSVSLPSHLGLHHHAEGSHAGYTLDDILLLSRSTVPAQRASMLGILAKIARRLSRQVRQISHPEESIVFSGQEGELRKRILAAGLAAIDQVGSLGARAVEVVWECLVEWHGTESEPEGVELALAPDIVATVQLDYLLPQFTDVLSRAALPSESLAQLLAVIYWLAQQSSRVADMITATPRLVPVILDTFLLTSILAMDDPTPPNPLALRVLITLASASRSNASVLLDPADALLRFTTLLPPSSPYPPPLANTLLTFTLRFYATLASYGLYSHIATTASQIFSNLALYLLPRSPHELEPVSESALRQVRLEWVSLVQAWTVCATDPHATNLPHDILWSQVRAWEWATDARKLRRGLGNETSDWTLYAAMWDFDSAWLEGARINGIKGGEGEQEEVLQILRDTFATDKGIEFGVVQRAVEAVRGSLGEGAPTTTREGELVLKLLASAGTVLASSLRLWLACLPPFGDGAPLSAPPFALPFSELSALSALLVNHPIWSLPLTLGAAHLRVYLRPLTRFIICFHRVSRYIPGTTLQLWFAQALVFLPCLLPGDESCAYAMLDAISLVTPHFVGLDPAELPQGMRMDVLRPFFEYAVRPNKEVYVAPLRPTTESISRSTTLLLPPISSGDADGDSARTFAAGLPLARDFLFTPLTHLLRSGTSPLFRALPEDWSASEVEVVRATLLLAYGARRVLGAHGLDAFVHTAAEVVFACMRVCMLEHGVGSSGPDVDTEVFRDGGVVWLMRSLLAPFTTRNIYTASGVGPGRLEDPPHAATPVVPRAYTLEDASAGYLGTTPFYQFYTDLVALYGAVSFGHPTFAALIVTPLAMHCAVDYRRALWCGGDGVSAGGPESTAPGSGLGAGVGDIDIVRSVRVPIEDVVCTALAKGGDPREYLYPIERDAGVLGAYVAALVARDGAAVQEFMRLVAVHHVACTVWGDADSEQREATEAERTRQEEVRAKLWRAVFVHGETDVVRDVVLYRQRRRTQGAFVWPPTCYRGGEDGGRGVGVDSAGWRDERLAFVRRTTGEDTAGRVREIFLSSAVC